jgi:DmsE family decaheme c-type cytochrome
MSAAKLALAALLALAGFAWPVAAIAQAGASAPASARAASAPVASASAATAPALASSGAAGQGTEYSEKGADTCLGCHDEEADTATFKATGIFRTKHAQRGDKHGPFGPGALQCEACHGPGDGHATGKGGKKTLTINSFKASSFLSVEERNQPCLGCHAGRARTGWHASVHERAGLACTDCHRLHVERDAVLTKADQPEVCLACHRTQRADFQKTSTHPVRFGLMACSDCHNPHGSSTVAMLNKPTVNQTCFSCHAEKRGPMLWEHAPVAEDCTLCHSPHGAVRAALLNKSPPLLCQQCHTVAGHPAVARTGAALPGGGGGGSIFLLAGSCTNCHSQVHGSNHPAGAKLMR